MRAQGQEQELPEHKDCTKREGSRWVRKEDQANSIPAAIAPQRATKRPKTRPEIRASTLAVVTAALGAGRRGEGQPEMLQENFTAVEISQHPKELLGEQPQHHCGV